MVCLSTSCVSLKKVLLALFLLFGVQRIDACGVCHAVVPLQLRRGPTSGLDFAAINRLVEHKPFVVAGVIVAHRAMTSQRVRSTLLAEQEKKESTTDEKEGAREDTDDAPMSTAMIASIGFYKRFISPLLPPACRFLPTCSQYGVQAIQQFGPSKGAILTAWRLLRCSPFGGRGYDPPKWPPVPYTYGSY